MPACTFRGDAVWRSSAPLRLRFSGRRASRRKRGTRRGCDTHRSPRSRRAQYREVMPAVVVVLGDEGRCRSAGDEMVRGMRGMLGRTVASGEPACRTNPRSSSAHERAAAMLPPALFLDGRLDPRPITSSCSFGRHVRYLVVTGDSDRGVLYGAFALLRKMALGQPLTSLDEQQTPGGAHPLGQPVGQPRWHDRARLRRPIDLLGRRACRARI